MFVALVGHEPDAASSEAAIFVRNRGGWRLNKKTLRGSWIEGWIGAPD